MTTLKRLRMNENLTQKEVAHAAQVLPQEIYRWESGANQLPYRHVHVLAKLLNVDREELIVIAYNTYMNHQP